MKKTRKWIVIFTINFVTYVIDRMLLSSNLYWFPETWEQSLIFNFYDWVISLGALALAIYFMYKWTTEYNLKNFGYESKGEWKKANLLQQNITQKIKQYSGDTSSNINDIDTNTSEEIPTEKIKDTSMKTTEKLTDIPKNLKPKVTMSKDDKRKQIREWHDMLTQGIITESDFEKKISDLSKSE